jgi:type VI secretion system protein ImpG
MYLSFHSLAGENASPPVETISVQLTCTNRGLARVLRVGDVASPTRSSPEFARFRNITKPTGPMSPPMDGDLFWRLISNLSLNYLSLANAEALRGVLSLYNFAGATDRQLARENDARVAAIAAVNARHEESLFRGGVHRGLAVEVELDEQGFGGDGDVALFGAVLDEFFALYATLNCTSRLTVKGSRTGEVYEWPTRLGRQYLL